MWIVTAKTLGDALGRQCCSSFLIMAAWLACPTWLGEGKARGPGRTVSLPWVISQAGFFVDVQQCCGQQHTKGKQFSSLLDDFCDLFQLDLSQSGVTKSSPQPDVALLVPVAPSPWWDSSQSISSHLSLLEGNETPSKIPGKGTSCREQTQALGASGHHPHANTRAGCQGDPPLQILSINPQLWASVYLLP